MFEELEAVGDVLGGVDVEWRTVFGCQSCEVGSIAVEEAIAVGEGTWTGLDLRLLCGDLFWQT